MSERRIRDLGFVPGVLPVGPLNAITDVAGVRVGHVTYIEGDNVRTGATAILPHGGNLYQDKVPAGVVVGNGYGTTEVELKDGRSVTGRIVEDAPSRLRLVASGPVEHVLARTEIAEVNGKPAIRTSELSLMPEGLELGRFEHPSRLAHQVQVASRLRFRRTAFGLNHGGHPILIHRGLSTIARHQRYRHARNAGEQDLVGDDPLLEVGESDRRQHRRQDQVEGDLGRIVPVDGDGGGEERAHGELGQRVTGRDRRPAAASAAAEDQPAEYRDVVAGGDLGAARRALGAREDQRHPPWHPVGDGGGEAAGGEAEEEGDDDGRGHGRSFYAERRLPIRRDGPTVRGPP